MTGFDEVTTRQAKASIFDSWDLNHRTAMDALKVIAASPASPEEEIMAWLLNSEANPYEVFAEKDACEALSTAEHALGLFNRIRHAFVDDGDICFVNTEAHGPFIVFADHREGFFDEYFRRMQALKGHGDDVLRRITGETA